MAIYTLRLTLVSKTGGVQKPSSLEFRVESDSWEEAYTRLKSIAARIVSCPSTQMDNLMGEVNYPALPEPAVPYHELISIYNTNQTLPTIPFLTHLDSNGAPMVISYPQVGSNLAPMITTAPTTSGDLTGTYSNNYGTYTGVDGTFTFTFVPAPTENNQNG
jgi:hypothetical protein